MNKKEKSIIGMVVSVGVLFLCTTLFDYVQKEPLDFFGKSLLITFGFFGMAWVVCFIEFIYLAVRKK